MGDPGQPGRQRPWLPYLVAFLVVFVAPFAALCFAIGSVDPTSPDFLGPCDLGDTALVSGGWAEATAAVLLVIVYAVVAGFIAMRRQPSRVIDVRRSKLKAMGIISAFLAAVLCSLGYLLVWSMATRAFCIPF